MIEFLVRPLLAAVMVVVLQDAAPSPLRSLDVSRLQLSAPIEAATFSNDELHGFPMRLAWSPDGRQLTLRATHRDLWANEKNWFYVFTPGDTKLTPSEGEPPWAGAYWLWKSQLTCPGQPDLRVVVDTRVERKTATASGAGGAIAQNAADPYGAGFDLGPQGQAIVQGAWQSQQVATTTLTLKGAVLGEFVNASPLFGLMYGWAPEGMAAMAYANSGRALVIMDHSGHRYEVRGTKGVLLPAWSPDGKRLAWIRQQGRSKFTLLIADVTSR